MKSGSLPFRRITGSGGLLTALVFAAVIGAALLHASWNALVKNSADKHVGTLSFVMGHIPFAVVALFFVPTPEPESWPYIAGGVAMHLGYQTFLLLAYRVGDLTQVYPIARGVAPMIVALISLSFLGVVLTSQELIAVGLIGLGIFSLVLVRGVDGLRNPVAAGFAIATGCFIAGYSLIDGYGARASGSPVGYYSWLSIINAVLFSGLMMVWKPGTVRRVFSDAWKLSLIGGGASFVAYSLVVWAFTQAPIPLVTALRETSIVFALLIGVLFLGEKLNLGKVISTVITLGGAILLRFAR